MRRYLYILIMISLLFTACKKEVKTVPVKKALPKEYSSNTAYSIDSILFKNYPTTVKAYYREHDYKTMWTAASDRKALLEFIADIETDGLQPKDYSLEKLESLEVKRKSMQDCIDYDILLSHSFHKLANHLFKGKLTPREVYNDWDLPAKTIDAKKLLADALEKHSVTAILSNCRPPHAIYEGLRKSYIAISALPDDASYKKILYNDQIRVNDSNAIVPAIKQRLAYWKDLDADYAIGSVYDSKTVTVVKKFQARHGIYADGVINGKTVEALNVSRKKRLEQLTVNLERWKWFAYDFGKRAVVINIPNYWLAVVENNKDTIAMHKVVVGKPERRTPILYSKFNFLVVNPTWTVPPTILKEDLVPSATKDRSYFANHNMKIYDWKKNEILPEDWIAETPDQYYYVQGPGNGNSLGEIKFNFNNSHTVYLHDTNHREYFVRANRALSSGCVRVQNPFKLADYLLKEETGDWSLEKVQELVTAKETVNLPLKKVNFVHQLYWTAWMDKGGIQFRPDIYNLDNVLYQKLRK